MDGSELEDDQFEFVGRWFAAIRQECVAVAQPIVAQSPRWDHIDRVLTVSWRNEETAGERKRMCQMNGIV